jgi:hypothetical protein
MRFVRSDVRDHVASQKSDDGPSYRRYRAFQRRSCPKFNISEIFGDVRFSTTVSVIRRPRQSCLTLVCLSSAVKFEGRLTHVPSRAGNSLFVRWRASCKRFARQLFVKTLLGVEAAGILFLFEPSLHNTRQQGFEQRSLIVAGDTVLPPFEQADLELEAARADEPDQPHDDRR